MKRRILALLLCLLPAAPALASWYYNEDGGIGAYQPEGWTVEHNGRSSRLTSPAGHGALSTIFFGSDWVSHVDTLEALRAYVAKEAHRDPRAFRFSDLDGFRVGTEEKGAIYLLRQAENVIVIEYEIRGGAEEREEARTVLGSVEVRTDANVYP